MTQQYTGITNFVSDISRGKIGEEIFVNDFLKFMGISFKDVTGVQGFRVIDSDFIAASGLYEIKTNYKDDKQLIIEEFTNVSEQYAPRSFGWFYKSKADVLVFISKVTHAMIIVPFSREFKLHYETIKDNYELKLNKVSQFNGRKWQSAFRRIPLEAINGYFAYYKLGN